MLEDKGEKLIEKLVEKAEQGDIRALALCLDRIFPARKERSIHLELRPVQNAQDLPIQFQEIASAVAQGRITPSEGAAMSNILTNHARAMEAVELECRVEKLEAYQEEVRAYRRESDMTVNGGLEQLKKKE